MPNQAVVISAATLVTGLVLEVDGWPQRRHQIGVRIGTEPLEDGSQITDHATREPDVVRLTGIVGTLGGAQRPTTAWETLRRLAGPPPTVVEVITEWGNYPEALILAVAGDTTGRDLTFALTVQEIVRVAAPVQVPELSAAARAAAARAAAAERTLATGDADAGVSIANQILRLRAELAAGGLSFGVEARSRMELDRLRQIEANSARYAYTASGDRYLRTVPERVAGGNKLSFVDPQDARLVQTAAGDYYLVPDPRIASTGERPKTEQVAIGQGEQAIVRNTERERSQAELDELSASVRGARGVLRQAQDVEATAAAEVRRLVQAEMDLRREFPGRLSPTSLEGIRVATARSRTARAREVLATAASATSVAADRLAATEGLRDKFVKARVGLADGRSAPLRRGRVPLGAPLRSVVVPERVQRPR